MEATEWLEKFEPSFARLTADERKAIDDFSRLWAFFEGTNLGRDANTKTIVASVQKLKDSGALTLLPFGEAICYFRDRYFRDGNYTSNFHDLNFTGADQKRRAQIFVENSTTDDVEIFSGLLIVIYRLRNNLFHGAKWADGIRGQLDNFHHSNRVLMKVMEMHRSA